MPGYFFKYVAPKIAKNLTQRRKIKDEAFKSIDEKGKGLSLQKRSNIKKSFSGKVSKILDDASKARKGKMGGGMMGRRMGLKLGSLKPGVLKTVKKIIDESKAKKQDKARVKKMGGGMMGRRMGYSEGKLAVTPREKQLAAQYGDKKRITRGDVITAAKKKSGEEPMRDRMKQPLKKKGT